MMDQTFVSCFAVPPNIYQLTEWRSPPEHGAHALTGYSTHLQATRKALVVAMRSWAGIHLLASDPRGLVTLMRILRDPSSSFSEDGGLQDVRLVLRFALRSF